MSEKTIIIMSLLSRLYKGAEMKPDWVYQKIVEIRADIDNMPSRIEGTLDIKDEERKANNRALNCLFKNHNYIFTTMNMEEQKMKHDYFKQIKYEHRIKMTIDSANYPKRITVPLDLKEEERYERGFLLNRSNETQFDVIEYIQNI